MGGNSSGGVPSWINQKAKENIITENNFPLHSNLNQIFIFCFDVILSDYKINWVIW